MMWRLPFGVVSIGVGVFLLYAALASFPFDPFTACLVTPSPGVHFSTDWTLQYRNACGGPYDYYRVYLLGFTLGGAILVGGGSATVREALR